MKMKFKSNRKAFTLVELLIVIAIIGVLFVVLVSKVDFATDKAKSTGVQTDFRSFQIAFETVSRENAGFNSLGWDTGDKADASLIAGYTYLNADKDGGDRIRNSYDKGDMNLNGICEDGETWTGQKLYTETWTGVYTLDNPADATDMSAYLALEKAINKNLDPALQISIDPENKTIFMANGYQDPWTTEYHGFYLSNAAGDGMDRGAIVMYSDGPNKVFGSEQTIAKGKVTVTVKNGGINGQDDLSLVTCYTYMNGYGEVATMTEGFSNNQVLSNNGNAGVESMFVPGAGGYLMSVGDLSIVSGESVEFVSKADISTFQGVKVNNQLVDPDYYTVTEGSTKVNLKPEYISTLPAGTYDIEILSTDGSAKSSLTVKVALWGDVDDDGDIDAQDVSLLRDYIANLNYDTGVSTIQVSKYADVNGDGEIGGGDLLLLRKYLANMNYDTGVSTVVLGPKLALWGDANGDGVINSTDVDLLTSYIANLDYDTGISTVQVSKYADVNGDGVIRGTDQMLLNQYVNNYDPVTGTSSVVLGPQVFSWGDVNTDGFIDENDLTLLREYIANLDYDTGTSTVTVSEYSDVDNNGSVGASDYLLLNKYIKDYNPATGTSSVVLGPQ